jgi:hypothetical protein
MDGCPFHSSWPSSASRKMWRALQTGADGVARHVLGAAHIRHEAAKSSKEDIILRVGQEGRFHAPLRWEIVARFGNVGVIPPSLLSWLTTVQTVGHLPHGTP